MNGSSLPPGGSPNDLTLELAMTAMSNERANRPRVYIIFAGLLLAAALGYLFWVVSTRGAAARTLNSSRNQFNNLQLLTNQLKANYTDEVAKLYEPDAKLALTLERLAKEMGLDALPPTSGTDLRPVRGYYVTKQYSVKIQDKDPNQIFAWLLKVTDGAMVPGLDVSSLKLTPGFKLSPSQVGWNADISFKRIQRDE